VRRGAETPLDKGQPLAGWDIEGMRPKRAESLLRDMGICFSFSYYRPTRQEDIAYSERWCTAPPTGRISGAPSYGEDGEVILYVEDGRLHPIREQPPTGWNCPLD
jgi:hypothetical protein